MGAFKFGKDAVTYYSATAKTTASDSSGLSWVEYDNVRDVTGNFEGETVDTTTRASAKLGWDSQETVLNSGEITFELLEKTAADTTLDALIDAFLNQTLVTFMFLNGPIATTGNRGLAANYSVKMSQGQPVKGVQTWNVTLRAAEFHEWYTVA